MITLFATIFDTVGSVNLKPDGKSDFESLTRRGGRKATLDGGAYNDDLGFTDSDRILTLRFPFITSDEVVIVKHLTRDYNEIGVITPDGAFTARPGLLNIGEDVEIQLEILSRLSE